METNKQLGEHHKLGRLFILSYGHYHRKVREYKYIPPYVCFIEDILTTNAVLADLLYLNKQN